MSNSQSVESLGETFLLVVEGTVGGVQVKQVEPTGLLRAGLDFVLQDGVVAGEGGMLEWNITDWQPGTDLS